ncbi:coniferyl-alcohol dehydrogenase [Phenylobacterium sp.]|jgi:NAD(P)-dependent dehydrogenase (short-subunit alcohol dehydrogenase family)|uniref:coniferyl-alcohol dehydrogenase n=1 Tax=Phenylobacterium sp. TaxID=1871053 RepID=UPI002F40F9FA
MSVWDYSGKRAVIVGCYSGMGEAAARELVRLGAEVHGFDVRPSPVDLASFTTVDLRSPASIDAAVKTLDGDIDVLFNCAGLPGGTFSPADVMKVNFSGMRYWTEQWLPRIRKGGAIASISSTAGFGYLQRMATVLELLATPDFDAASAWVEAHPDIVTQGYSFSKEAISVWTMLMGTRTIKQGVRINCICPGPTQTPMMGDFEKAASAKVVDVFVQPINRRSTPVEQAYPLIFLNSDAASFVNGHVLNVDGGFVGGVLTGQIDVRESIAKAMTG